MLSNIDKVYLRCYFKGQITFLSLGVREGLIELFSEHSEEEINQLAIE